MHAAGVVEVAAATAASEDQRGGVQHSDGHSLAASVRERERETYPQRLGREWCQAGGERGTRGKGRGVGGRSASAQRHTAGSGARQRGSIRRSIARPAAWHSPAEWDYARAGCGELRGLARRAAVQRRWWAGGSSSPRRGRQALSSAGGGCSRRDACARSCRCGTGLQPMRPVCRGAA